METHWAVGKYSRSICYGFGCFQYYLIYLYINAYIGWQNNSVFTFQFKQHLGIGLRVKPHQFCTLTFQWYFPWAAIVSRLPHNWHAVYFRKNAQMFTKYSVIGDFVRIFLKWLMYLSSIKPFVLPLNWSSIVLSWHAQHFHKFSTFLRWHNGVGSWLHEEFTIDDTARVPPNFTLNSIKSLFATCLFFYTLIKLSRILAILIVRNPLITTIFTKHIN